MRTAFLSHDPFASRPTQRWRESRSGSYSLSLFPYNFPLFRFRSDVLMDDTSARTYVLEGVKVSLDILSDISSNLLVPAATIINLAKRIVETLEVLSALQRSLCRH